jgi:hypothetical protein
MSNFEYLFLAKPLPLAVFVTYIFCATAIELIGHRHNWRMKNEGSLGLAGKHELNWAALAVSETE